tara:strand:+ start:550 stop:720 length:171 start_codon:yes stop_codon:yes gene_type:complete
MNLSHDETISLIELLKKIVEYELEDEDDTFSDWDSTIIKLYAHLHKIKVAMGETNT